MATQRRGAYQASGIAGEQTATPASAFVTPSLLPYAPILHSMVDGVMVADASGRIVVANEAAARIFGVGREELLVAMQTYPERFALRTADGASSPTPVGRRALAGEIVEPVERLIRTPEGIDKHLRTSAAPIRDASGVVIGAIVLIADITAEKSAEARARQQAEELRKAYEGAQEAIRQRDEVLAVVSHDLRSPLGVVSVAASSIARMATDDRIVKAAESANRAVRRMARLIDDLLIVTRAGGGKLELELAETSPADIVAEIVDAFEPLAADARVTLRRELSSPPPPPIACDGARVVQALSNYLTNALELTPGGVVTVRAEAVADEVRFSVRDTGPGIAAADLPRVFDRYWRAADVSYRGTGLGLAIAKAIAEAHGGRVWAESDAGAGSAFFLALPAATTRSRGP
jgi:PAS domain S-box-containing protein